MAGQDSDGGGEAHRKCVRCIQGLCGGFGTRRPSNQESFSKMFLNTSSRVITRTQTHTRDLLSLLLLDSPKTYDGPAWRSLNDDVRVILRTRARTRIPAHAHAHTHADAHLRFVQAGRAV